MLVHHTTDPESNLRASAPDLVKHVNYLCEQRRLPTLPDRVAETTAQAVLRRIKGKTRPTLGKGRTGSRIEEWVAALVVVVRQASDRSILTGDQLNLNVNALLREAGDQPFRAVDVRGELAAVVEQLRLSRKSETSRD